VNQLEEAKTKAIAAYNAASDYFDNPVSSFWRRFGRQTVERLALQSGQNVLDVCCGSGGSAIPAAEFVGPAGKVIATDIADRLVELGRAKAAAKGLSNLEFRTDDMLALGYPDASFDAVICVFGIFFVPDMVLATKELWRMVHPGGRLAITTWGPKLFEPGNTAFWDAIGKVRPDLVGGFSPWERISEPTSLRKMFLESGIGSVEISEEAGHHSLSCPEDWWAIAMGSGYRGTIEKLAPISFSRVKKLNLESLKQMKAAAIETNVLYAVATKSAT
jgi:ubiquinone/menaquinone biosynthesis C-methylase UbiE